jgi:hypothetical protein
MNGLVRYKGKKEIERKESYQAAPNTFMDFFRRQQHVLWRNYSNYLSSVED